MKTVLNVGGNNKNIALPVQYHEWKHVLLDIDPLGNPDLLCDARNLSSLPGAQYDAVYCSHNLEHYHPHEVPKVLLGFKHILNDNGFAHIRVPDLGELMQIVVKRNLDIDDFLYQSNAGPITVRDVIYGFGAQIERSGIDFFAHKTGFTKKSLLSALRLAGFSTVAIGSGKLEISALAFKNEPDEHTARLFKINGLEACPTVEEPSQPLAEVMS